MKSYKYTTDSGSERELIIKPLQTKYLKTLYKVFNKFNAVELANKDKSEDEKSLAMLELLSSDLMDGVVEVVSATVKRSAPSWSEDEVDDFVAKNYMALLPVIAELNFPK